LRRASSPEPASAGAALRALVVQHEQPTPAGYVSDWLEQRGAEQDVLRIDVDEREIEARAFDLVVALGSERAAFDDSVPWLEREQRLLASAAHDDVPILGICFGGQLLARVLGGRALRGQRAEIGWLAVRTRDASLVDEGPWFQWHFDTFAPPPGARLIADSPAGPQAFAIGRSLGLQFHPEVTPEIVEHWVEVYRHELGAEGVDPERLLAETRRRARSARAAAWRLFDAFLNRALGAQ
jgi:GMP synthase-like glutamine amidotransferase